MCFNTNNLKEIAIVKFCLVLKAIKERVFVDRMTSQIITVFFFSHSFNPYLVDGGDKKGYDWFTELSF